MRLVQWGGTVVHAEELQEFTLDPMVVTAQRMETRDLDTPASVNVITEAEIKDAGYKNVFDAIEHQLGMTSTGYGDAGQALGWNKGRTVIRGFDRGTLVLVDGIPLNLKNYNETESVPLDFVERIEIVKGAAGTLYGAEAMGGVVNIITKRVVPGQEEVILRGTVGNYYKDYNVTVNTKDIMISAGKEYSDSNADCNDYPKGSSTDWWVGKGQRSKAGIVANLSDEVRANFFYSEGKITRGGHKYSATKPADYDYEYDNTRITGGIVYEGKNNGIKATLGYNYLEHDDFDYIKNKKLDTNVVMDSYMADIQKAWDIGQDTLITGYTFKRENYDNQVVESEVAHKRSNSVYISYDKKFNDKFNMTFGLRGEQYSDYATDENVLLPQIQSLYKFDENTSWYINIGKAFQMPTVDAYFDYEQFSGLSPEEGWNYETGFKKIDGKKIYKVAVYHMDFENKFGWSGTKDALGYDYVVNKGDFRNTGIEFEMTNNVDENWRYKLGLGYGNPEINNPTNNDGWVQDAGRIDVSANLSYKNRDVSSDLTFKYLGDREDYSSKQIPARARLTWNTTYKFTPNDSVTLTMNNLFDRRNYSNKYGSLDLPFNWKVMYTHTF